MEDGDERFQSGVAAAAFQDASRRTTNARGLLYLMAGMA